MAMATLHPLLQLSRTPSRSPRQLSLQCSTQSPSLTWVYQRRAALSRKPLQVKQQLHLQALMRMTRQLHLTEHLRPNGTAWVPLRQGPDSTLNPSRLGAMRPPQTSQPGMGRRRLTTLADPKQMVLQLALPLHCRSIPEPGLDRLSPLVALHLILEA